MAHRKGWFAGLAALALVAVFGLVVVAQDKDKDKGGKDKGHSYSGKITKVDADKRMISVEGTGKVEKDKTADKDKGVKGGGTWAFMVERGATVTLDGKKAELSDLKANQYARVQAAAGGDKDKVEKDKGGKGGHMTATRVEAFTKQPTEKRD